MERSLKITEDGSHTIFVKGLEESYHSSHGAIQESMHIFINQGLKDHPFKNIRILETGFGTGLNAFLSCQFAKDHKLHIFYHSVEKYPLYKTEYNALNYHELIPGSKASSLREMHEAPWEKDIELSAHFILHKELSDFRTMKPAGTFDLIFFDAFAPEKQPDLWSQEVFTKIYQLCNPGALLITYSSKGDVRRALQASSFKVEKVPGPPGKREIVRAKKE